MVKELPQFVCDLLSSPPQAGDGFHNWLFRVARVLHPYRPEEDIYAILESAAATCGRHVSQKEITDAVKNSKDAAWNPRHPTGLNIKPARWSPPDKDRIKQILADGLEIYDLWEASPVTWEDGESHTEEIIDILFPDNPLLCVGRSATQFKTRFREELRGELASLSFIVPSPMTKPKGLTKDGRESEHTLDNTGGRRFLVIEFDKDKDENEQATKLMHLKEYAPLTLALRSGGKSVHGWFYCQGLPEDRLRRFMDYAVSIGADPATWTKSQFVRMPDGLRDNGNRQLVLFFNPQTLEKQL